MLFLRKRGERARVSALGASLLVDARETLRHHDRLRRANGRGAADSLVIYVRSFLLGQIKKRLPALYGQGLPREARFTVVDDKQDIASLVETEKGSVGILRTDFFPANERIVSMLIRSDAGSLYCTPQLASLAKGRADVRDLDILVPAQQAGLEVYTFRLLARAGIGRERIKPGSQFIELLLEEVLEGGGAAVFFDDTVKDLVEQGSLVRLLTASEPYYLILVANRSIDQGALTSIGNAFSKI